MSRSSKKKCKVPKITEEEYARYISALKEGESLPFERQGKDETEKFT